MNAICGKGMECYVYMDTNMYGLKLSDSSVKLTLESRFESVIEQFGLA